MKIYTKKGDLGETNDGQGRRVLKCDFNITAVGDIDELNAVLGVIKINNIDKIQEDLFVVGSMISRFKIYDLRIKNLNNRIIFFEKEIDRMWGEMPELKSFIFFGGTEKASLLFFARAVARRAERSVVALKREDLAAVVKYLNRLSDYLFCLGRYENFKQGEKEKIWRSG